jgi:hypothetical protein
MAHSFMTVATTSATPMSSLPPSSMVALSDL